MAVNSLDNHVRVDAEQLAFPLLNQVRRADHERHLIRANIVLKRLDRAGSDGDCRGAALCGFADPHLTDQQDAVTLLEALRDSSNDVFLCGIQRILALQPDAIQPARKTIHIKLVSWRELVIEIACQRLFVVGDELQQCFIAVHLDQRAVVR
jgi:hypothetical protein